MEFIKPLLKTDQNQYESLTTIEARHRLADHRAVCTAEIALPSGAP